MRILRETMDKFEIGGELLSFLWHRKLWWMIPLVAILVFFGIIIVVGSATGVGPFIYTIF